MKSPGAVDRPGGGVAGTALDSDILLLGQPNVGKSALFSRLTGIRTLESNYPGTTISYTVGKLRFAGSNYGVTDAPGTYALKPLDEAGRVTANLLGSARRIINVIDATHLERHLPLSIELLTLGVPMVIALNMSDEASHQGIRIDADRLSELIGVPVIPIIARSGEGVKRLIETTLSLPLPEKDGERIDPDTLDSAFIGRHRVWERVGELVEEVQTITHHHHRIGQRLEELSVHPWWGSLCAALLLMASFSLVRLIGEFLIGGTIGIMGEPWARLPFGTALFFERVLLPYLTRISERIGQDGFLHRLLIGTLVDGRIDFEQSFGLLTAGLFIPLGIVLPYLLSFYFVLALLEDSGYLPRLAVFLDTFMHRFGLHGYAIIPTLLGLGCNVPGIMATRILETRRQRFVAATLISVAIPCAALQAMIIGIVGSRGIVPVLLVFGILFFVWMLVSLILRFTSREFRPELLLEIPPYRLPAPRAILSKMWLRLSGFLREALPVIGVSILVVNVLDQVNLLGVLSRAVEPVVVDLWGLPTGAALPLLVGILRKDVAMGLFASLQVTTPQLVIGSVMLAMFFPCLATLVVLFRELGLKDGFKSTGVMLLAVLLIGSILNLLL